jgi:hypothetical protein
MTFRYRSVLAVLVLATACGEGPTTVVGFEGALVFSYSGSNSGSFNASGVLPTTSAEQRTSPWAAGYVEPGNQTSVAAAVPRSASTHDFVDLYINRNTVGSSTISSSCSSSCSGLNIIIGASNTGASSTASCFLTAGSIAITEKSETRMKGTFSGTGTCVSSTGSSGAFTATGGTFDVAFVSGGPV